MQDAEKYLDDNSQKLRSWRKAKGTKEADESLEKFYQEMEMRFGFRDPQDGRVVQGEDLIGFDKFTEYQENM